MRTASSLVASLVSALALASGAALAGSFVGCESFTDCERLRICPREDEGVGGGGGLGGGDGTGLGGAVSGAGGKPEEPVLFEDCSNGSDDDEDGDVDEEDSDCDPCVPRAPAGWQGPLFLYVGDPTEAPECGERLFQAGANIVPGELSCSACSCQSAGQTCTKRMWHYNHPTCGGAPPVAYDVGAACVLIADGNFDDDSIRVDPPIATETCIPSGGNEVWSTESEFEDVVFGCLPTLERGTCESDRWARPIPSEGFAPKLCISQTGEIACPETFPQQYLYGTAIDDRRSCSECGCSSNITCTTTLRASIYSECNSGAGTSFTSTPVTDCYGVPNNAVAVKDYGESRVYSNAGCIVESASPGGDVVPVDPVTVCCQ